VAAINSDFASETGPERFADGQRVTLACVVTGVKTKTTRNNSLMAYVNLEDDTGGIEMLVFSKVLGECGSYLKEGTALLVDGRISVRDEKAPQIMCNSVRPLEKADADAVPYGGGGATIRPTNADKPGVLPGKSKFYLRVPNIQDERVSYIRKLLIMFPGEGQLIFYAQDTGKRYGLPCLIHSSLLRELREVLGEENVVVK
jgi:DNA polymerase-3 subunit alpha